MHLFARAVITGFAFTLGAALFKKVSKQLGLEDAPPRTTEAAAATEPAPQ